MQEILKNTSLFFFINIKSYADLCIEFEEPESWMSKHQQMIQNNIFHMEYIQPKSTSIITFAKKHCSSDSFFESVPHAVVCQCHQTLPGQLNAHFLVNTDILYKSILHHLQGFENTKKCI